MSLSERECRALADIELQLAGETPRLVDRLSGFGRTRERRRRRARTLRLVCVAAGIGGLAAGMQLGGGSGTVVAVLGYCLAAVAIVTGLPPL